MHMPKDSLQIVALLHVISVVISTNLRFYLFGKTAARTAISTYQGTSAYLRSVAVMMLWFSKQFHFEQSAVHLQFFHYT